ncbi:hypothetical protein BDW02DRAFT_571511 [Decorospora gaudefroyi]|uniref:Uncharacterized protein n=1 Tax=Decorospora gaudefroyi TaxID=184978 RepID=A0A6A5KA39_9PLEO|nr:hypothetical protein BDW02DRAFT_571511 [Decorospora gaudefroyi]
MMARVENDMQQLHFGQQLDTYLWIRLYYGLLRAIAGLPTEPLVFHNPIEAHEQFVRTFGENAGSTSIEDLIAKRDKLVPVLYSDLVRIMKPRLQKGGHPKVYGVAITQLDLAMYRAISKESEGAMSPPDNGARNKLLELLGNLAEKYNPKGGQASATMERQEIAPATEISTPVSNTAPKQNSTFRKRPWSESETAYLELLFIKIKAAAATTEGLKMPEPARVTKALNELCKSRDSGFIPRDTSQVGSYFRRSQSFLSQLRQDSGLPLGRGDEGYMPTITESEFQEYLKNRQAVADNETIVGQTVETGESSKSGASRKR